jgi:hypothetical protein
MAENTNPPGEPPERYHLDNITMEELAAVFTWAQIVVDAQMTDEAAEEMQHLMQDLSDRLGLQYSEGDLLDIEEVPADDGSDRTFKVRLGVKTTLPRPALVWTNDQPTKPGLKIVDKDYVEPTIVESNDNEDDEPEPPKLA